MSILKKGYSIPNIISSADYKEHTNKAGQFQQHTSGNDEDFG